VNASDWTESELISLQNAYDRDVNGHDDVVTLIRGVRALLRACDSRDEPGGDPGFRWTLGTDEIRAALNLDTIGDTP
jgi:hypothetical protein